MRTAVCLLIFLTVLLLPCPVRAITHVAAVDDASGYSSKVLQKVLKVWDPPQLQGAYFVQVRVSLNEKGQVQRCVPTQPSSLEVFDQVACAAVRKAQPFGRTPYEAPMDVYLSFNSQPPNPKAKNKALSDADALHREAEARARIERMLGEQRASQAEESARIRAEDAARMSGRTLPEISPKPAALPSPKSRAQAGTPVKGTQTARSKAAAAMQPKTDPTPVQARTNLPVKGAAAVQPKPSAVAQPATDLKLTPVQAKTALPLKGAQAAQPKAALQSVQAKTALPAKGAAAVQPKTAAPAQPKTALQSVQPKTALPVKGAAAVQPKAAVPVQPKTNLPVKGAAAVQPKTSDLRPGTQAVMPAKSAVTQKQRTTVPAAAQKSTAASETHRDVAAGSTAPMTAKQVPHVSAQEEARLYHTYVLGLERAINRKLVVPMAVQKDQTGTVIVHVDENGVTRRAMMTRSTKNAELDDLIMRKIMDQYAPPPAVLVGKKLFVIVRPTQQK